MSENYEKRYSQFLRFKKKCIILYNIKTWNLHIWDAEKSFLTYLVRWVSKFHIYIPLMDNSLHLLFLSFEELI